MTSNRYYKRRKEKDLATIIVILLLLAVFAPQQLQHLRPLLPYGIVVVILLLGSLIYRIYRFHLLSRSGIVAIDTMSGTEFEERLVILFRNLGYKVTHVGHTSDAGVDLIIELNGRKTAVQAKRYESNVGEAAVQQVHTGRDYYRCEDALIVTNSNFTPMAWRVARATNVKLWNRNYLIKILLTEKEKIGKTTTTTVQE